MSIYQRRAEPILHSFFVRFSASQMNSTLHLLILWCLPKLLAGESVGSMRCSSLYLTVSRLSPWGGSNKVYLASSFLSRDSKILTTISGGTACRPTWSNKATCKRFWEKSPHIIFSATAQEQLRFSPEIMTNTWKFFLYGLPTMFRTCLYRKPEPSTSSRKRGP